MPVMKNRIRELRGGCGLTQEALARAVGVRRETIVFLEQGKYNPSLQLAHEVAQKLGVGLDEVFIWS